MDGVERWDWAAPQTSALRRRESYPIIGADLLPIESAILG